jgi:hypothetical protein
MARSTGRKRFWFQQNREEDQLQATENINELSND